ncbi:MAG: DNA primase [Candidatus Sumerlaeia bacterium]|nr:DNA primase [Candidatus Sumerlaeia bacterium]
MPPSPEFQHAIRRIREEADLLEIVGRHVELKRKGGRYWGCCPFHGEKTPSFCVRPEVGYYHCFGCAEGGDVFKFLQRTESLSFIEAVRKLAKELRIELPAHSSVPVEVSDAEEKLRTQIEAANRHALEFYRRMLAEGRNPAANAYLPKRGLGPEMIERFKLGAALDAWSALTDAMVRDGFERELLVAAGLSVKSEKGSFYDRFRNRLIFPIHDHNGKCIGFGGRALVDEPDSPKYLNSAETPVYKKSRSLYGLDVALKAIKETGHAFLCEGYMDVVSAHAAGIENAVGSLGTALTPEQSRLLHRFTKRVYFFYDGDNAGRKAMLRGGESLLAADLDTRVLLLPQGEDPDTFVRAQGADAVRALQRDAAEFIDFAVAEALKEADTATINGQAELVERLLPYLAAMKNEAVREASIARVVAKTPGIPRDTVRRMLERRADRAPREDGPVRQPDHPADGEDGHSERQAPRAAQMDRLERGLLKLMLESSEALDAIRARLHHDWVRDARLAPWVFTLIDHDLPVSRLLDAIDHDSGELPEDKAVVSELLAWDMPLSPKPHADADELLLRLEERHQRLIVREIIEELTVQADPDGQARALMALHLESRNRLSVGEGRLRKRRS